jgi:hypothetical protein
VLPRAAARQSVPQPGSGRSPPHHGHVRRSMATVAGRGTLRWMATASATLLAVAGQRAPRMSHITLTVPGMNKPPGRYDVTVRVAKDDGHSPDPAAFAAAASQAASR